MLGQIVPFSESTDPPEENDDARLIELLERRKALLEEIADVEYILETDYERVF